MGDFNWSTPTAQGLETRYAWSWNAPDWTRDLKAQQQRIRPGATTITNVHLCLPVVKGAPGLAVEVVDTQQPAATFTDFFPGSDTGDVTTNWEDAAAAALNFGDIDDPFQTAIYGTNSVALSAAALATARFRGNNAGALAGRRILRVQIQALIMNRRIVGTGVSGSSTSLPAQGAVIIGANTYKGNLRSVPKMDSFQYLPDLGDWFLSPATGIPWTVTEVDNIISAANADKFGVDVYGRVDDAGMRMTAMWLRVWHCLENRRGFLYQRGTPRRGWDRYTLGTTSAVSANTYYWVQVGALTSSLLDYFSLGYVYPMEGMPTDAPTSTTQEHRVTSSVIVSGPGGAGQAGADKISTGQTMFGMLLEAAGPTILSQSQPYSSVDFKDRYNGATANVGTQITSAGAQPVGGYAGVTALVGWQDTNTRPDRPLVVTVRGGVGAISGGGTLLATGTLQPEAMIQGDPTDTFIKFNVAWTPANATQYHVFFDSAATAGQGWRIPRDDSRSDLVLTGSGTTVANVEGATQGGQTDSYVEAGAANDRYDLPVALTAPPATPTITVTEYPAEPLSNLVDGRCQSSLPPRLKVTWPATSLGTSFGAYHVWVRRHATPAELPILVASIEPDADHTAANVETYHREHWLYELGWSVVGSGYADGWDVGISSVNATTMLESLINWTQVPNQTDATSISWVTSDAAPWLNTPLITQRDADSDPLVGPHVYPEVAGRDHAVVRVSGNVPGRRYNLKWDVLTDQSNFWPDEALLRGPRAAATSGRQMSLLRVRGDRAIGNLSEPSTSITDAGLQATSDFVTTSGDPALAGVNMPPGYVLNGTTQSLNTPANGVFIPAGAPFTVFCMAVFPNAAGTAVACRQTGATDGYELAMSGATSLGFTVDGATTSVSVSETNVGWFDGNPHVAVGTHSGTGNTQQLFRDTIRVGTGTTNVGTVTNAQSFTAGVRGGGAAFAALNPLHAYGYYPRVLTQDEVAQLTRYLFGHAGYRAPAGANLFLDLRDARTYGHTAVASDLSGNGLDATIVASPVLRGNPWQLRDLERKR